LRQRRKKQASESWAATTVGIPVKPISHSARNPITIPEESDQASERSDASLSIVWEGDRFRQAGERRQGIRSGAEGRANREKRGAGKGRHVLSPLGNAETRNASAFRLFGWIFSQRITS
jgi:hypothetical protein